jgi:serine/threonine protein kinase
MSTRKPKEANSVREGSENIDIVAGDDIPPGGARFFCDRYEIIEQLATDVNSTLYKAKKDDSNVVIALRVFHSCNQSLTGTNEIIRKITHLKHKNIGTILETGRTGDGELFAACEVVPGISLSEVLVSEYLDPLRAVRLSKQLCEALSYAHQIGIVHQCLDLDAIFLGGGESESIKVTGFEKALEMLASSHDKSCAEIRLKYGGRFVSPEQKSKGRMDELSNVYSVGQILCAMLGKSGPNENADGWVAPVLDRPGSRNLPGAECRQNFDEMLEGICRKATAEDSELRHKSMLELLMELESAEQLLEDVSTRHRKLSQTAVIALLTILAALLLAIGLLKPDVTRKPEHISYAKARDYSSVCKYHSVSVHKSFSTGARNSPEYEYLPLQDFDHVRRTGDGHPLQFIGPNEVRFTKNCSPEVWAQNLNLPQFDPGNPERSFATVGDINCHEVGYLGSDGKEICKLDYNQCHGFYQGIAAVRGERWQFINYGGKPVGELDDRSLELRYVPFCGLISVERTASLPGQHRSWKVGCVNERGKIVVPCVYDEAIPLKKDLVLARQNSAWGAVDDQGRTILDFKYDAIRLPFGSLIMVWQGDKCGVIERDSARAVVPIKNLQVEIGPRNIAAEEERNRWRIYNRKGALLLQNAFSRVYLGGATSAVLVGRDSSWGIIDNTTGNLLMRCYCFSQTLANSKGVEEDAAWSRYFPNALSTPVVWDMNKDYIWTEFMDGLARVVTADRKVGLLTRDGHWVVRPKYEDIAFPQRYRSHWFRTGRPHGVQREHVGLSYVGDVPANSCNYVDISGREISDSGFEKGREFSEGMAAVCRDGKWGYIDETGRVGIPFVFEEAQSFSEGLAAVLIDGKWGYLDTSGNMIVIPVFSMAESFCGGLAAVHFLPPHSVKPEDIEKYGKAGAELVRMKSGVLVRSRLPG